MSAGGSRVSIPSDVRKTIQDIREITAKHSDDDIYAMLTECNMDPDETAQRLLYLDGFQEVKKKHDRRKVNVNNRVFQESRWRPGAQGRGARGGRGNFSSSYVFNGPGDGRNVSSRKEHGISNRMERNSKPSVSVPEKTDNVNPRVTNSSIVPVNRPKSASDGSSSHERGTQSSPDPMVVPSLSSQIHGTGAIKCEMNSPRIAAESRVINPAGNRSNTSNDIANNINAALGDMASMLKESKVVENNQPLEPSQATSSITRFGSSEVISIQDDLSSQQLDDPSKVVVSDAAALTVEVCSESLPEPNVTPKLDLKLEKLNISAHQPVIFPNHLQVPENFKNGLVFGSLDATLEQIVDHVNNSDDTESSMPTEPLKESDEPAKEASTSNPSVASTAQEGDYLDNPHYPPHVPDNSKPLNGSILSGAAPKYDQSKPTIMVPQGGHQYPFVLTAPNYGFPIIQPMLGNPMVQCEGPDPQSGNSLVSSTSGSTPIASQPAGVGQSSIAASPPPFPVFRQPYPPNYFPFGPYFPFYFNSNAHQILVHGGFPQQPSIGNPYISPPAASPGVKFTVPQSKPELNAGNPTQFGIPSGYGSYNPNHAVTSGSFTGNEDLTASESKNKVYTTLQGDGPFAWFPASGRDLSSFHANSSYNHLPQGQQHVGFSPTQPGHAPFGGIYHPAQTMTATSAASPLLQPSKAMSRPTEVAEPPSGSHQHPQHAINWNSIY
ncbi:GBF-interacting protein [Actinidia chinensis var. chinensis]|uniref:GBF-interacting protein n=1 Tax=Actinidia chinensis var. chinensis TaxID=1590841 RepID=A0A2R6P578_ACTCC|nr:GBF-interacting protein [Actinidia chinensis var. chinensis]